MSFSSHFSQQIKLLIVIAITSLLHLQLIIWMFDSFKSIQTLPNQINTLPVASLKIRFVTINPQTNPFNQQLGNHSGKYYPSAATTNWFESGTAHGD